MLVCAAASPKGLWRSAQRLPRRRGYLGFARQTPVQPRMGLWPANLRMAIRPIATAAEQSRNPFRVGENCGDRGPNAGLGVAGPLGLDRPAPATGPIVRPFYPPQVRPAQVRRAPPCPRQAEPHPPNPSGWLTDCPNGAGDDSPGSGPPRTATLGNQPPMESSLSHPMGEGARRAGEGVPAWYRLSGMLTQQSRLGGGGSLNEPSRVGSPGVSKSLWVRTCRDCCEQSPHPARGQRSVEVSVNSKDQPPILDSGVVKPCHINHSASFGSNDSINIVKPRTQASKATQRLVALLANGRIRKNETTATIAMPPRTTG